MLNYTRIFLSQCHMLAYQEKWCFAAADKTHTLYLLSLTWIQILLIPSQHKLQIQLLSWTTREGSYFLRISSKVEWKNCIFLQRLQSWHGQPWCMVDVTDLPLYIHIFLCWFPLCWVIVCSSYRCLHMHCTLVLASLHGLFMCGMQKKHGAIWYITMVEQV